MDANHIRDQVNQRYGSVVKSRTGSYEQTVAKAFGYTEEELAGLPEGANLGLSCGNPLALAKLREGETAIDMGSGAGFDVFQASKKVGDTGRAIGVDMNKTMIDKSNATKASINASNVQFIRSAITSVPQLQDGTADCVISNCVVNLVPGPEKQLAFDEMFRLLRPGGRLAVSDILARRELSEDIRGSIALYVGCIAGASQVSEYHEFLENAGFRDVLIVDSKHDLNVYFNTAADDSEPSCCAACPPVDEGQPNRTCSSASDVDKCCETGKECPGCGEPAASAREQQVGPMAKEARRLASLTDMNKWAGSFQVYAVKPVTKEE